MTKRPTPRLHNSRTDWHGYKSEISNQVKGEWKLKTLEDIDAAVTKFTNILKQAAHLATRTTKIHGTTTFLPSKIKCLVAPKRKATATLQKTHAPEDRILNNATNKLRTALHTLRNENFTTFVSSLSNSDHSIWKRIKSRKKVVRASPPIRKNSTPPGPWVKSDDKAKLFTSQLAEVYTPTLTPDPEVESMLANHTKCHVKTRPLKASNLTAS
jgi:hypothetical protein